MAAKLARSLILVAEDLAGHDPPLEAFRRRAVSTAYYAAFHALAELCADYVTRSGARHSADYERAYRALDHGSIKNALARPPLSEVGNLVRIGAALAMLQSERHRADYLPDSALVLTNERVVNIVDTARTAVNEIERIDLDTDVARTLAISLLFRERR